MRSAIFLLVLLSGASATYPSVLDPQAEQLETVAAESRGALRVFLDCNSCDFDFVRRSILFVEWVRDRLDAQVHALVTEQATGPGGAEFTLTLIGREEFESVREVIRVKTDHTDTRQEVRESLTHTLELGLLRFTAGTELGRQLRVVFEPEANEVEATSEPEADPWKFWVFSVGLDGFSGGQESASSFALGASIAANRTTEEWKIRSSAIGNYAADTFELSGNETFESVSRRYSVKSLVVKSLGDHWSLGIRASGDTSTFSNTDRSLRLAPAIEYSLFPYGESSERELRLLYSIGVNDFKYAEETIFGVTEETLYDSKLSFSVDFVQPWGSAQVTLEASALLEDLSENRLTLSGGVDWRIFRGLSVVLLAGAAHIADQRSISAGGVIDEEILLQRRELLTSFSYNISLGFGFTFGSKFASVVNPRFQ